jgi:spore coat polysaccharide biosynthesis protein SpsF
MLPLAGKPLIRRLLERVVWTELVDEAVLAIPEVKEDDVLATVADQQAVSVFRGSELDVLDRHYQAALAHSADQIVRIPGDNPVPDASHVDRTIAHHIATGAAFTSTYPELLDNGYISGLGCEVFTFAALEQAWKTSRDPRNREHPHTFFYDHRDLFKIETIQFPRELRRPGLVLDVNTLEDYQFMARLYEDLYPVNPRFGTSEIVDWYDGLEGRHNG